MGRKYNRLATYVSEHELPPIYKTAALEKLLVGEAIRNFDVWNSEGMSYDKLILKLKDYARMADPSTLTLFNAGEAAEEAFGSCWSVGFRKR